MRLLGLGSKKNSRSGLDPSIKPDDDRWYAPFLSLFNTQAGMAVSHDNAMTYAPVAAAVRLLAETIGSVPLILYKRTEDGKERADSNPLYSLIKNGPCKTQRLTSSQWRMWSMMQMLLQGDAFTQIVHSPDGKVSEFGMLDPSKMSPKFDPDLGYVVYEYQKAPGHKVVLDYDEVMHLRMYPSEDGLKGRSVLSWARETAGFGMALESFGSNFFNNSAAPAGALKMGPDMDLSDKARSRVKKEFKQKYGGVRKAGEIVILEEGLEWQQIGLPQQDTQWLEARKFTVNDIARFFRVPPHLIGDLERATFSNIEHQSLEFLMFTMLPNFTLWEEVLQRDLLGGSEKYFFEFLIAGLARGDIKTRFSAYAIGRQWGWLSANDIRAFENQNKIEGGDVYLTPINMADASDPEKSLNPDESTMSPPATPKGTSKNPKDNPKEPSAKEKKEAELILHDVKVRKEAQKTAGKVSKTPIFRAKEAQNAVFSDLFGRILRKEFEAVTHAGKLAHKRQKLDEFYADFPKFVKETLRSAVVSYREQVRMFGELSGVAIEDGYQDCDNILEDVCGQVAARKDEVPTNHAQSAGLHAAALTDMIEKVVLKNIEA